MREGFYFSMCRCSENVSSYVASEEETAILENEVRIKTEKVRESQFRQCN